MKKTMNIVYLEEDINTQTTVEMFIEGWEYLINDTPNLMMSNSQKIILDYKNKENVNLLLLGDYIEGKNYESPKHLSDFRAAYPNAKICIMSIDKFGLKETGADYSIQKKGISWIKELQKLILEVAKSI